MRGGRKRATVMPVGLKLEHGQCGIASRPTGQSLATVWARTWFEGLSVALFNGLGNVDRRRSR